MITCTRCGEEIDNWFTHLHACIITETDIAINVEIVSGNESIIINGVEIPVSKEKLKIIEEILKL